jgi:hypothetical protein
VVHVACERLAARPVRAPRPRQAGSPAELQLALASSGFVEAGPPPRDQPPVVAAEVGHVPVVGAPRRRIAAARSSFDEAENGMATLWVRTPAAY